MLQPNLTIVPVTLHPNEEDSPTPNSTQSTCSPSCTIKTAAAEIFFFNGVDERIIQGFMKEWIHR